ncbi:MAG TPA: hypothetical protein VHS74_05505 [Solirubrobacterales bacterium]|nr:hypothetical protein [Solirubrobacterales bacterium]
MALTLVIAACGGKSATAPPAAGPTSPGAPALLKQKVEKGEVMVDAEYSPHRDGPYRFDGTYQVRFAQYDPEAPRTNFAHQTPFVAYLTGLGRRPKKITLFHQAAAGGRRTMRLHGKYFVEVSFGDFPYVLRFTPTG